MKKEADVFSGEATGIAAFAWSPDGQYAAMAEENETGRHSVLIRRTAGLHVVEELDGRLSRTWWDGDVSPYRVVEELEGPDGITEISWSPDGKFLLSVDRNGAIYIWEGDTFKHLGAVESAHGGPHAIFGVAWSPDSRWFATIGADERVRIWLPYSGGTHVFQVQSAVASKRPETISWSPCGGFVAVGGQRCDNDDTGAVSIIDVRERLQRLGSEQELHPGHPFWPRPRVRIVTDDTMHQSRGSGLVILEEKWLFFWREGNIHNAIDPNAAVMMGESTDQGRTIKNIRVLYKENSAVGGSDIRARLMGNGRIGVFGGRLDASRPGRALMPFFAFSDDTGKTWTARVLDELPIESTASFSPSFTFNEFPASAGGHDGEGFVLFCHGGGGMYAVYTIDNGENWNAQKLFDDPVREVSVVRLGDSDRWLMTGRDHRNPAFRSTDMLTWEGPFDTGKRIGRQPSGIVYNQGYITWIGASRPYHYVNNDGRAVPVNGEVFKGLVTTTVDAERIWRDPTDWPDWSVLAYLPVHYDGTFVLHEGRWYMIFGAIEGPMAIGRKTYSQLGIMSSIHAPFSFNNSRR